MNLCIFSHYSDTPHIPYYVITYLKELKRHNDEVLLMTNQRDIGNETGYMDSLGIRVTMVENEGFDFGMWSKGLALVDTTQYKRITLANDSCILFKELDDIYAKSERFAYYGAINSNEINYHIQSFFLVINKRAISTVKEYFDSRGIIKSGVVQDVIHVYEVGLSQHMIQKGLGVGSYVNCNDYRFRDANVMLLHSRDLLDKLPFVKTKVTEGKYRPEEKSYMEHFGFDFDFDYHQAINQRRSI